MINLPAILIANAAGIMLMLIVAVNSTSTMRYGLLDEKLFNVMLLLTIFECVIEPCTFIVDGMAVPALRQANLILNVLLYIFNIVFAYTWTVYADYKIFGSITRLKRIYGWVALPGLLVCLAIAANLFVPVFFTISSENVYARTSLFFIPYTVTYAYLLVGVVVAYAFRRNQNKYLFLPAAVFMVPIIIGSALQFMFYGLSLVWLGVSIAVVSLYINVQNEAVSVDQLSGLYSRQYFMNYLRAEFNRAGEGRPLAGIMLDVDRFKSINDTYGHHVGDEAIEVMGAILRECTAERGRAARYAGDEFVITMSTNDEAAIGQMIDKVHARCKLHNESGEYPFNLSFSAGYALYEGGDDSLDKFLERMDASMYTQKRAMAGSFEQ